MKIKLIYTLIILLFTSIKPIEEKITVLISDQLKPYVVEYLKVLDENNIEWGLLQFLIMLQFY